MVTNTFMRLVNAVEKGLDEGKRVKGKRCAEMAPKS